MTNVNKEMVEYGTFRSVIRDIAAYGRARAKIIGKENVFDFSIGNPSVSPPEKISTTICDLTKELSPIELHGYTAAAGDEDTRNAIAENLNARFNSEVTKDDIYLTCGAAASLAITLKALINSGDEVIAIAPYFPEYKVYVETLGAKYVSVKSNMTTFQIDIPELEKAITNNTKAIIVNYPNNPTGVVLNPQCVKAFCELLNKKSKEFGHSIYILSDEPYRELVYDESTIVPCFINEYDATIVSYSFSKSLSLPGERIGYIVVSNKMADNEEVYAAVCGAGRALGFICAPSLMQKVIARCINEKTDLLIYKTNRDLLYNSLKEYGYNCVYPDGAFYLFVKSPIPDAYEFCERAKKYELLFVPSDSFGCNGYVRLAYCVSTDMIQKSLPAFKKLISEYK